MVERSENPAYREKIATFSGIEPEQVNPEVLELHLNSVLDMTHNPSYVSDYIDLGLRYRDNRRYVERMNNLVQLTEGLLDTSPIFISYGVHALDYLAVLDEQKEKNMGSERHVALLVGAMTTNTVNEFTQTLKSVFKNPTPLIIDIDGKDIVEESKGKAHFVFADALSQPFQPGCIDTVHTNNLLEHLQSYVGSADMVKEFFQQSFTSLREGGQIILVEKDPNEETDEFTNDITTGLVQTGFQSVRTEPANKFTKRRYVDDYFAGVDLPDDAIEVVENMKVFIATK